MRIFMAVLAVLVGVAGAAAAQESANVPFRKTERGLILVDVHVNEQGPFPFLIDTGATSSVIFDSLAERLDVPDTGQGYAIVHGIVESGEHPTTILGSLRIGEARVPAIDAIVLKSASEKRDWLGIIGLDFLAEFIFIFRNKTETLELFKRERLPSRAFSGWRRLPVYHDTTLKRPYRLLFVPIRLDGRKVDALIDLGSTTPILNWPAARSIGFDRMYRRLEDQWLVEGATGEFRPRTIIKDVEIEIGQLKSKGSLLVADSKVLSELNRADTPFLILNAALFSRGEFAVDVETPAFYVKPQRSLPRSIVTW